MDSANNTQLNYQTSSTVSYQFNKIYLENRGEDWFQLRLYETQT